ncbi:MAG: hypothetical protein ACI9UN_004834 [Granulosicoccus sp.]|jgi:hypothetical protein
MKIMCIVGTNVLLICVAVLTMLPRVHFQVISHGLSFADVLCQAEVFVVIHNNMASVQKKCIDAIVGQSEWSGACVVND